MSAENKIEGVEPLAETLIDAGLIRADRLADGSLAYQLTKPGRQSRIFIVGQDR